MIEIRSLVLSRWVETMFQACNRENAVKFKKRYLVPCAQCGQSVLSARLACSEAVCVRVLQTGMRKKSVERAVETMQGLAVLYAYNAT